MLEVEITEKIKINNRQLFEGINETLSTYQKIELIKSIVRDMEGKNPFHAKSLKRQIKYFLNE